MESLVLAVLKVLKVIAVTAARNVMAMSEESVSLSTEGLPAGVMVVRIVTRVRVA